MNCFISLCFKEKSLFIYLISTTFKYVIIRIIHLQSVKGFKLSSNIILSINHNLQYFIIKRSMIMFYTQF